MFSLNNLYSKNTGFSLIELMVALVLGLVVSAAAIQIFASNKGTYRLENALTRMQENGRFVVDNIIEDLRMAGYKGCLSRGAGVPVNILAAAPLPFAIDGSDAIRGYNNSSSVWAPAIDANLNLGGRGILPGTDVLNIQRAATCVAQLDSPPGSVADLHVDVVMPNNCGFAVEQVVMVTNCSVADVFQIEDITGTALERSGGSLSTIYQQESQVFRWLSNAYYIATSTTGSGEPALFRSSWDPDGDTDIQPDDFAITELADGVENMQVLYGVDTGVDEYADTYLTANNVTNWEAVRSIRISLLLRSEDFVTQEPREFDFDGTTLNTGTGADRRLRTAYTTTVSLRNNIP